MFDDIRGLIGFILFFAILCVAVGGFALGASRLLVEVKCSSFEATGYETEVFGLSCYAKVDGKYVPAEYVFGKAVELRTKN